MQPTITIEFYCCGHKASFKKQTCGVHGCPCGSFVDWTPFYYRATTNAKITSSFHQDCRDYFDQRGITHYTDTGGDVVGLPFDSLYKIICVKDGLILLDSNKGKKVSFSTLKSAMKRANKIHNEEVKNEND